MRLPITLACAAFAIAIPGLARAQAGSLDERTEYTVISGASDGDRHGRALAIILWRGQSGWLSVTNLSAPRVDSAYRFAHRDAEDRHLSFFGSGLAYGLLSSDHRQLTVEGRTFEIGRTDSTLVIMVAVPDFGLPRAVTTARILGDAIPDAFWPRTWESGDTTFIVHARPPRSAQMLRSALETSRVVRDYLR